MRGEEMPPTARQPPANRPPTARQPPSTAPHASNRPTTASFPAQRITPIRAAESWGGRLAGGWRAVTRVKRCRLSCSILLLDNQPFQTVVLSPRRK